MCEGLIHRLNDLCLFWGFLFTFQVKHVQWPFLRSTFEQKNPKLVSYGKNITFFPLLSFTALEFASMPILSGFMFMFSVSERAHF